VPSCLACGLEVAATSHGADHDLADVLCLACLVEALAAAPRPAVVGSGVTPTALHSRTCSGQRHRCPRPPTDHRINASWCAVCAPPPPDPPTAGRASDSRPDDPVMLEALRAILPVARLLRSRDGYPYGEPLEGQ
jgi:hypothetical protein